MCNTLHRYKSEALGWRRERGKGGEGEREREHGYQDHEPFPLPTLPLTHPPPTHPTPPHPHHVPYSPPWSSCFNFGLGLQGYQEYPNS